MLKRLLFGICALLGAGIGAQLPEYTQQYLQRLGGRLDTFARQTEALARDAQAEGLTVTRYLELFLDSSVSAHRRLGMRLADGLAEFERLQAAQKALLDAPPAGRPLVMLAQLDTDLALATLESFNPAVPLSAGGLLYALGGGVALALAGLLGGRLAASVRRRAAGRARSRQAAR